MIMFFKSCNTFFTHIGVEVVASDTLSDVEAVSLEISVNLEGGGGGMGEYYV